jgi:hypothetical protein
VSVARASTRERQKEAYIDLVQEARVEESRSADAEPTVEEERLQVFPLHGVVLRYKSKHSVPKTPKSKLTQIDVE